MKTGEAILILRLTYYVLVQISCSVCCPNYFILAAILVYIQIVLASHKEQEIIKNEKIEDTKFFLEI